MIKGLIIEKGATWVERKNKRRRKTGMKSKLLVP